MNIQWLGHASFLLTEGHWRIFIDPYGESSLYTGKADLICITHDHYDHFSQELISSIRTDQTIILCPPGVAKQLDGAHVLDAGQTYEGNFCTVQAVPAYNISKQFHPKGAGVGFIIAFGGKRVYHAGDTDCIPEMNDYKTDVALLPVGGTYTMNPDEAAQATEILKPQRVIPMHFGSIVGTQDDADTFADLARETCEVTLLKPGEEIEL